MENVKTQWIKHIKQERGYSKTTATWMADRIESLIDHMQYGHAVIAYRSAINGEFRFVKATLLHYNHDFKKEYKAERVQEAVVFQNVEEEKWQRFRIENFMEWKPVV